ncbi:MAG TPA: MraY family glycosyltransferase [Streptosporangiaceae bacterium]|nr:MraY family glycosyltransferase [Streptosporangiaceae bacterium]
MQEYVVTLLAAAAVTYLLTPLVRRFAIAVGARHAARERDVHVDPVPLVGGLAMYGGLVAGLLVASRLPSLHGAFAGTRMAAGVLLAGGLLVVVGFVDDRWGLGVFSKLAAQVAAGAILVWSGAELYWLPKPGGTLEITPDEQAVVTILVVVVTINAVNFIDGLDGLAAGIVGIGAAAFFAYYYYLLTRPLGIADLTGPALTSAVLTGMCLGFLPHNFHPARIFMGDTGSMLIGLLLAYAPIASLASINPGALAGSTTYVHGTANRFGAIAPLLVPAAILLVPYADLLLAVVRRTRAGMSPFAPDKKHLQHRLLEIGHSHRTSVLIMYLWAGLFAGVVVWLSILQTPLLELAGVSLAMLIGLLLLSMPRLRPWRRAAGTDAVPRAVSKVAVPDAASKVAVPVGRPMSGGLSSSPGAGFWPAPPPLKPASEAPARDSAGSPYRPGPGSATPNGPSGPRNGRPDAPWPYGLTPPGPPPLPSPWPSTASLADTPGPATPEPPSPWPAPQPATAPPAPPDPTFPWLPGTADPDSLATSSRPTWADPLPDLPRRAAPWSDASPLTPPPSTPLWPPASPPDSA